MELGANDAVVRAVQFGAGIAVLSEALVRPELKAGTLAALTISDSPIRRRLWIARHVERRDFALALRFIDTVRVIRDERPAVVSVSRKARSRRR